MGHIHKNPILHVSFYRAASGRESVRDWIKSLTKEEKKKIGEDVKLAQFGWPQGMPLIRLLGKGLYEIRSSLANKISRVIFTVDNERMILLHGFIKKSQKTPLKDLELAKKCLANLHSGK